MVNLTGLRNFLESSLDYYQRILADGGYQADLFMTPDKDKGKSWNDQQKGLRSVVETVFALIHFWGAATKKFHGSPELQECCLIIIYNLVSSYLKDYPLRPLLNNIVSFSN